MVAELSILAADDMGGCRDLYRLWLADDYDLTTVADGTAALEQVDDGIDVLLLDRDMPGVSGEEVAKEIDRAGYDVHVIMVSSMEVDFDILSFPVDGYLEKPVGQDDIRGAIESFAAQQRYERALSEYFSLSSKLAAVESSTTVEQRVSSERYQTLKERVEMKRREVDEAISEGGDWNVAFSSVDHPTGECDPPSV